MLVDSITFIMIALIIRYVSITMEALMSMTRLVIQLPKSLKAKLDAVRATGTTASGLIRHLLTQHFDQPENRQKGRHA